jgi:adenine C2-methylase RlmN of 23S rRNA A2503 and tRNA A37
VLSLSSLSLPLSLSLHLSISSWLAEAHTNFRTSFAMIYQALRIAMDGDGIAISRRRITLSTSGVVPLIEAVGRDLSIMLAISLHAVR